MLLGLIACLAPEEPAPPLDLTVTCRRSSCRVPCAARCILFAVRQSTAPGPGVELACSRKHQVEQATDDKSVADLKRLACSHSRLRVTVPLLHRSRGLPVESDCHSMLPRGGPSNAPAVSSLFAWCAAQSCGPGDRGPVRTITQPLTLVSPPPRVSCSRGEDCSPSPTLAAVAHGESHEPRRFLLTAATSQYFLTDRPRALVHAHKVSVRPQKKGPRLCHGYTAVASPPPAVSLQPCDTSPSAVPRYRPRPILPASIKQ